MKSKAGLMRLNCLVFLLIGSCIFKWGPNRGCLLFCLQCWLWFYLGCAGCWVHCRERTDKPASASEMLEEDTLYIFSVPKRK